MPATRSSSASTPKTAPAGYSLGVGAAPSSGTLDCAEPIVGGFARALSEYSEVRNLVGCPLAPEHNTHVRAWADKRDAGTLALWPDDDSPDWLLLFGKPWPGNGAYRHADVSSKPPGNDLGFGPPERSPRVSCSDSNRAATSCLSAA
jgi:hypothetical protein